MHSVQVPRVEPEGDVLLVVPPFAAVAYPSLAVHLLQACGRQAGYRVSVLYASLSWARQIGPSVYHRISRSAPNDELLGERIFAEAAFGIEPPLLDQEDPDHRRAAPVWADALAGTIAELDYGIVGCTVTFEQTVASLALLNRVKAMRPDVTTVLGGGNCEGPMADGLASLKTGVDYIFRGESERSFVDFLRALEADEAPAGRIVEGAPCFELDGLPTPDFSEFFDQHNQLFADRPKDDGSLWIMYETSRGCWWGEKSHCTFCGFNGVTMSFREKSADRVIQELRTLTERHPTRRICLSDNIMPFRYFDSLLPRLRPELGDLRLYYEEKSNLNLDKVRALGDAGITEIQAGIEALSTALLKRMKKGVNARLNLLMLRYARSVGLQVSWSLLCDFPGDQERDYQETLELLPLLRHIEPPTAVHSLTIDRFSPYFEQAEAHALDNLRPLSGYREVFPAGARIDDLAFHFRADYPSVARRRPELIAELRRAVESWREVHRRTGARTPVLSVHQHDEDRFVLIDTRGLSGVEPLRILDREQAKEALAPWSLRRQPAAQWALDGRIAVEVDGWYVPLATADPDLLQRFENEIGHGLGRLARSPQALAAPAAPVGGTA